MSTNDTPIPVNVLDQASGGNWHAYHGDCVEVARGLPDRSVALSVFSPPFASLYTYSNSPRDMGNVRSDAEFFAHFDFLVRELARVMMRGRIVAFHCMDMPTSKERDGYIGLRDFPGDLIRAFQKHGFVLHSKHTIWKDPVTAMQRTKALGLLHKTVRENASMSRAGIPDYLIAMRAPGDVPVEERVRHTTDAYPVDKWQQIASPVWAVTTAEGVKAAIDPQDTLQHQSAREHDDERHICPLQLEVILRAVELWTNPGDVVFSPYMGIGSEGHIALGGATRAGRRLDSPRKFVGAELKASYFRQSVANLRAASGGDRQTSLFDLVRTGGGPILRAPMREAGAPSDAIDVTHAIDPATGEAVARPDDMGGRVEKSEKAQKKRARKAKPAESAPTAPASQPAPEGIVRLRAPRAQWDALRPAAREDLSASFGGIHIEWREDGDGFCAVVPASIVAAVRGVAEAHGVELAESEARAA